MATPTPGKATVAATPPVSTPFSQSHLAFSPARPLPSPHPKKSPANSHTIYNHSSSNSFPMNFDSPSAAAALGALPNIGLEGLTIDAFAGAGEGQRLASVLEIISGNKGRVSEDGLENLAKRVGLESLWEDQMGGGGRTLIIAGTGIALEIDFRAGIVAKVKLIFPEAPVTVTSHAEAAGAVLLRDLELRKGESLLTKMLDRFAGNLERLAALDKLGVGVNCYEAVAGIYESLKRLWEWELEKLRRDEKPTTEDAYEKLVMCTKSGRPEMHAHDRIGLSVTYWTTQHRITSPSLKEKPWWILIECAALAFTYPIRVSSQWISPAIQKVTPTAEELMENTTGNILDWLDPEQTFLPGEEKKLPEVMFVARCEPAVIVPFHVANRILTTLNLPPETYATQTFDGLLFPPTPDEVLSAGEKRILRRCKSIPVRQDGVKAYRKHQNELHIDKIDFGRAISSLPFSHPKELISILPWLRQYAMLSTLLHNSFGDSSTPVPQSKKPSSNKLDAFDAFMAAQSAVVPEDNSVDLAIDVTISTSSPQPELIINFPFKDRAATIVFDVQLGGLLHTRSETVLVDQKQKDGKRLEPRDLANMLEICEDIGTFVEFVRWRL